MESFADGRSQGNFRKAPPKYEELLLEVVEKEPLEYGYEFGRWTTNITFLRKMRYDVTDLNESEKYRTRKCPAALIKWSAHSICSTHSIHSTDNHQ